jgi:hypothetical protein
VDPHDRAGAAFRNPEPVAQRRDVAALAVRGRKFPAEMSLSMSMSRAWWATSFFNRAFSASRSLSRLAARRTAITRFAAPAQRNPEHRSATGATSDVNTRAGMWQKGQVKLMVDLRLLLSKGTADVQTVEMTGTSNISILQRSDSRKRPAPTSKGIGK